MTKRTRMARKTLFGCMVKHDYLGPFCLTSAETDVINRKYKHIGKACDSHTKRPKVKRK